MEEYNDRDIYNDLYSNIYLYVYLYLTSLWSACIVLTAEKKTFDFCATSCCKAFSTVSICVEYISAISKYDMFVDEGDDDEAGEEEEEEEDEEDVIE